MQALAGLVPGQAGRNLLAFLDAFKAVPRPEATSAVDGKERGD